MEKWANPPSYTHAQVGMSEHVKTLLCRVLDMFDIATTTAPYDVGTPYHGKTAPSSQFLLWYYVSLPLSSYLRHMDSSFVRYGHCAFSTPGTARLRFAEVLLFPTFGGRDDRQGQSLAMAWFHYATPRLRLFPAFLHSLSTIH